MGADPAACILSASVGNALGGMFCYWLGYIGNLEKIEKWLKIDQTKIHKFSDFVQRRGSWIGIFGFLPWVGEVILVLLGLMRTNVWTTSVFVFVGKLLRYVVWYVGVDTLLSLFA
jgi:membrane protein YqaA with SNARE-associated domain